MKKEIRTQCWQTIVVFCPVFLIFSCHECHRTNPMNPKQWTTRREHRSVPISHGENLLTSHFNACRIWIYSTSMTGKKSDSCPRTFWINARTMIHKLAHSPEFEKMSYVWGAMPHSIDSHCLCTRKMVPFCCCCLQHYFSFLQFFSRVHKRSL